MTTKKEILKQVVSGLAPHCSVVWWHPHGSYY